jgi:hypothetical protein
LDPFSYLSVLLSIIIGLAMTQVLQGFRALLLARARIVLFAPTLIWAALLLVMATQMWWASFGLEDYRGWSFANFGVILLQTVLLYLLAGLVLPDMPADQRIDLERHYFQERVPFFAITIALLGTSLLKDYMLDGRLPEAANVAFHLLFGAVAAGAIVIRSRRYHQLLALGMVLLIGGYVALLFARLD